MKRAARAEQLRHLRVAVHAVQRVLVALQRIEHGAVLEAVRELQPARVAGVGVEIGEHLVHAAELGVEHALRLRVVQLRENASPPSAANFISMSSAVRLPV